MNNVLRPSSSITTVYCTNYSIDFAYTVPEEQGKYATVILYEEDEKGSYQKHLIETKSHLPLQGNIMLATDRKGRFVVLVRGRPNESMAGKRFDFNECLTTAQVEEISRFSLSSDVDNDKASTLIIGAVLAATALLVFLSLLSMLAFNRYKKRTTGGRVVQASELSVSDDLLNCCQHEDVNIDIYLVFVNDNSYHEKAMTKFASYLQQDLGFRVIFELWEQRIVNCNYSEWIENATDKANKIVMVWSQGATRKWKAKDGFDDSKDVDSFTPVVKRLLDDRLFYRNLDKYCLVHFPYTRPEDIPGKIREKLKSHCFHLMKDMAELYIHLRDTERNVPGQTLNLPQVEANKYFLSSVTKMGSSLKKSIDDANNFAQTTLDWFEET